MTYHKRNLIWFTCKYEECKKKFKEFDNSERKFCSRPCEKLHQRTHFLVNKQYEL